MRVGGQKAKGNSFENRLAKDLSLWLTNGLLSDVLERSPSSGAKSTVRRKKNEKAANIVGDLISIAEEGNCLISKFVVEAKHQNEAGINVSSLIFRTSNSGIPSYWNKLLQECKDTNKLPMLIFKQNNRDPLIGMCKDGITLFDLIKHVHAIIKVGKKSLYLLKFDLFLEHANPKQLQ